MGQARRRLLKVNLNTRPSDEEVDRRHAVIQWRNGEENRKKKNRGETSAETKFQRERDRARTRTSVGAYRGEISSRKECINANRETKNAPRFTRRTKEQYVEPVGSRLPVSKSLPAVREFLRGNSRIRSGILLQSGPTKIDDSSCG